MHLEAFKALRHTFQQCYSNSYHGFHNRLGTRTGGEAFQGFVSKKNPQVSTSEAFLHAGKYAGGLKPLGKGVALLTPEYDERGKPKHPYLGKLFVILVPVAQLDELDPYFVVQGHAAGDITVSTFSANNILTEREVSFPGFVPGESVVLSASIRVPSFEGDYKPWYQEKYGISKRAYNARKKIITSLKIEKRTNTATTLLRDIIIPHAENKLKAHIKAECGRHAIRLVYKQLDGGFGNSLPVLQNAVDQGKRMREHAEK